MKKNYITIGFVLISTILFAQNNLLSGALNGNPLSGVVVYDIEFVESGNDLVLVVANANSGKIVAIDYNWSSATGVHDWTSNDVPSIISSIGAMVGTTAANLNVRDMKVNPKTKAVMMLMHNVSASTIFLVEVKSQTSISLVNLSGLDYCVMDYTPNSNYIMDMAWDPQGKLYYTTGDFTLDAEIGSISIPFVHGGSGTLTATTLFKSNWGGSYFTSAPLEMISVSTVDGTDRLMGVTTCAPGFSIPTSTIPGAGTLSVTEDFNMHRFYSLSVVTQTQGTGLTTTYLYDLHFNQSAPTQLIRVGEKYLDGSRAAASEINNSAQKIRTNTGALTSGLGNDEAIEIATGYYMIAKYSETQLMVVDDNEVLRLMDVTSTSLGVNNNTVGLIPLSIYPSPASDVIQFDLELKDDSNISIKIWDVEGKLVHHSDWNKEAVNISELSNGSYIANIQQNGIQIAQGKFIKQ